MPELFDEEIAFWKAEHERVAAEMERAAAEEAKVLERKYHERQVTVMRQAILVICTIFAALLVFVGQAGKGLQEFLMQNLYYILAGVVFYAGILIYALTNRRTETDFVDVDARRRAKRVIDPATAWPFPTNTRPVGADDEPKSVHQEEFSVGSDEEEILDDEPSGSIPGNQRANDEARKARHGAFSHRELVQQNLAVSADPIAIHFAEVANIFTQRAENADEKASLLLSKGTTYTIWGIVFFIASIIAWQVLSAMRGYKDEYIYGILSCTGLFIFIEFLSAWFLKQYRQFVDTATYLLKVKAIFDRYMLIYLAHGSFSGSSAASRDAAAKSFIRVLEQEIKWPETYLAKKEASSFADDATAAVTSLVKELRKDRRQEKREKTSTGESKGVEK